MMALITSNCGVKSGKSWCGAVVQTVTVPVGGVSKVDFYLTW